MMMMISLSGKNDKNEALWIEEKKITRYLFG